MAQFLWNHDGQRRTYLPNLFSYYGTSQVSRNDFFQRTGLLHYEAQDTPVQGQESFPFENPPGLATFMTAMNIPIVPLNISVGTMFALPLRTEDRSKTKVAESVLTLPFASQLHQVRCSSNLWDNLVEYAAARHMHRPNTYQINHAIATRGSQMRAICGLFGWFQKQLYRTQHLVNSEPDVQDVIFNDLISFANEALKVSTYSAPMLS